MYPNVSVSLCLYSGGMRAIFIDRSHKGINAYLFVKTHLLSVQLLYITYTKKASEKLLYVMELQNTLYMYFIGYPCFKTIG